MENGHLDLIFPLKAVICYSHVKLPEGMFKYISNLGDSVKRPMANTTRNVRTQSGLCSVAKLSTQGPVFQGLCESQINFFRGLTTQQ